MRKLVSRLSEYTYDKSDKSSGDAKKQPINAAELLKETLAVCQSERIYFGDMPLPLLLDTPLAAEALQFAESSPKNLDGRTGRVMVFCGDSWFIDLEARSAAVRYPAQPPPQGNTLTINGVYFHERFFCSFSNCASHRSAGGPL